MISKMGQECQCKDGANLLQFLWVLHMLREYRKRINLSQEELERRTEIDRKTIYRIENDLNMPLLDTFAKLVLALKLSDKEIAEEVKKSVQKNAKL